MLQEDWPVLCYSFHPLLWLSERLLMIDSSNLGCYYPISNVKEPAQLRIERGVTTSAIQFRLHPSFVLLPRNLEGATCSLSVC